MKYLNFQEKVDDFHFASCFLIITKSNKPQSDRISNNEKKNRDKSCEKESFFSHVNELLLVSVDFLFPLNSFRKKLL